MLAAKRNLSSRARRWTVLCLMLAAMIFFCPAVYADGEARNLNEQAEVQLVDPAGNSYPYMQLFDGRYTTKLTLPAGTEMSLSTEEAVYGVYLIWDRPPGSWALRVKEEKRTSMYLQGSEGWIHEYVELPEPSTRLTIVLPGREATLCEVVLLGKGVLPADIQVWEPPYEDADMLLLPTHADDEHLFFGGTMPYYAGELGYKVQVAYLTHHWAEPYRPHELLNGLWTVGIRAYPVIGEFQDFYSDSLEHAKELYDPERVVDHKVELLRRFRPEVVIGHDIDGEYGHGVHMLNTWALRQAIDLAADPEYRTVYDAARKPFQVSKVYLHLYPERSVIMNWGIPLEQFEGRTALEMAVEGFSQHVSQQKWFSVRTEGVHDCRAFGLYFTAVGDDPPGNDPDFFYNIDEFSDGDARGPEQGEEPSEPEGEDDEEGEESPGPTLPAISENKGAVILTVALTMLFLLLIVWAGKRERS